MKPAILMIIIAITFSGKGDLIAQVRIEGFIKDAINKTTLAGVNVKIKNTFIGTVSNSTGDFQLTTDLPFPIKLSLSYIGYQTEFLTINEPVNILEVELKPQSIITNEIIVTAQHREETLQKLPISIAVIDQNFIKNTSELDDPGDLVDYVPGFSGKNYSSNGSWYTIRGINTNAFSIGYDPSVAIFHDGIFNGRTPTAGRPFYDIERIEVLKGPQGSLFGRNAVAGVVSIHNRKPRFVNEFAFETRIGNWGQAFVKPSLNFKIGEKLAMRYAGVWEKRDGLREVKNFDNHQLGKKDILSNRISLLYRPNSSLNFLFKLEQLETSGGNWPLKGNNLDLGASNNPFDRSIELNLKPADDNIYYTTSLNLNWVINEALSLESISGLNTNEQSPFILDTDGTPTPISTFINPNNFTNVSQEFRLNGKTEQLDWLIAGSYFRENVNMNIQLDLNDFFLIPSVGFPPNFCETNPNCRINASELSKHKGNNVSWGIYGNLIYSLSSQFKANLGIRYSIDQKELDTRSVLGNGVFHSLINSNLQGPVDTISNKDSWRALQPQLTLQYDIGENLMLYGGYSRGFKAGGHNIYTANSFKSETNDAFEIGFKSNFMKERIRLNIATYYMIFNNLQVEFLENNIIEINNAGKTISSGVEIESGIELKNGVSLVTNAGFNFAEYKDFVVPGPDPEASLNFSGNVPNRSPKSQISVIGRYEKALKRLGDFVFRLDYTYQSREFYDRSNELDLSFNGYGLINSTVGLEGLFKKQLDISFFMSNITNEDYLVHIRQDPSGITNVIGAPRLFGFTFRFYSLLSN